MINKNNNILDYQNILRQVLDRTTIYQQINSAKNTNLHRYNKLDQLDKIKFRIAEILKYQSNEDLRLHKEFKKIFNNE